MSSTDPLREDLRSTVAARRELGPDYDDALVEGFLERVEARLAQRQPGRGHEAKPEKSAAWLLGAVSLGTGIPLTAISSTQAGFAGLVVTWVGIVGVNVAHALGQQRRRR